MTAAEFPAMIEAITASYALDMTLHGGLPAEAAQQKAAADMAEVLPQGLATPEHSIFVVEADGRPVGRLWVAVRQLAGTRTLYIYEVEIDADQRGRGLGRAAMALAEEQARRMGIGRLALNVFGGNHVARSLYRSLGYLETSVQMAKQLPPAE